MFHLMFQLMLLPSHEAEAKAETLTFQNKHFDFVNPKPKLICIHVCFRVMLNLNQ